MRTALEVHQRFFDTTLAARHFLDGTVTVGMRTGWRWSFLGVDMGAVPAFLRHVLPYTPPMWSDVAAEPLTTFQDGSRDHHDLFVREDDAWVCQIPDGWSAVLDGQPVQGDVPVTGTLDLQHGDVHYRAAIVPAPPAATRSTPEPDAPLLGTLGFLGATAALFAMAVAFAPDRPEVGLVELDERMVTMAVQIPEAPKPPPVKPKKQEVASSSGGSGPATPSSTPDSGGPRSDREVAQSAGLFASDLLDTLGGDLGGDLMAAAGQLQGLQSGRGPAIGSLAGRGTSLDGGGGTIGGIAGPGRVGPGPGGHAYGGGDRKTQGSIGRVSGGATTLVGSLKKSEIEAVIQRSMTSIRYCYQRQLQRSPDLAGKITVKFVVSGDGSVSSAGIKASSMGSPAVESCIVGRFQRMSFPRPRGGGMAIVSYPFLFSPG
jgi:outer membrane biosynthesis protein TonB